jgi:hypothetical protein
MHSTGECSTPQNYFAAAEVFVLTSVEGRVPGAARLANLLFASRAPVGCQSSLRKLAGSSFHTSSSWQWRLVMCLIASPELRFLPSR